MEYLLGYTASSWKTILLDSLFTIKRGLEAKKTGII